MVQSDFKNINVVPIGNEFVDLNLSRVHHQTPNFLLKGFNMNHLRQFYTRKVKKTEVTFHNKLSTIINEFPRLDEIHPFYDDLLRLSFDRDHYKFSLCQVDTARHMITNIANDYVTQLESGESLKQCKSLKASAIGTMFSVVNEITPSLAYIEQIRQHMVRLPSIDPNTPTLLICGYPNVGKTCFMSRVNTKAGADFTTKSVTFVAGHTDYKDLRYQVIEFLDRPTFGECNVIAALARHLPAALVFFFMDVSGSCGYSVAHQAALFHSLKSLFVNKPLVLVCDETDLMQVSEQDWKLIENITSENEEDVVLKISNLSTEECVKNAVCQRLFDGRERLSCIAQAKAEGLRNKYILARQEWKADIIPLAERDDDHNVSDLLVDPDVLFRVEELEREGLNKAHHEDDDDLVMAEEHFTEVCKDDQQLVAFRRIQPLRIIIALVYFFLLVALFLQRCQPLRILIQACLSYLFLFL